MNPIQNYHRWSMNPKLSNPELSNPELSNPELSNPENFVGTLYPRKFQPEQTSRINAFRKEFE